MVAKKRTPRTSKVDPNETKAGKFVRLGEQRLTKATMALRNLAKLGGNNYERTAEQQKKIGDLLRAEVEAVVKALVPHVPGSKTDKKAAVGPVIKL